MQMAYKEKGTNSEHRPLIHLRGPIGVNVIQVLKTSSTDFTGHESLWQID